MRIGWGGRRGWGLYQVNIFKRTNGFWGSVQGIEISSLGLGILSLQHLFGHFSVLDGLLDLLVLGSSLNDLGAAAGWTKVRSGDVNALFNDSSVNFLVDLNTDGSFIHIENNSSSSMVVLEWHTLVDRGIDLDINIISSLKI